jgi:hypothetical protein
MTRSRITLLAVASLMIAGSALDASAALASSPAHVSIVRTAPAPHTRLHGMGNLFVPHARATQTHDQDPFADLLLG